MLTLAAVSTLAPAAWAEDPPAFLLKWGEYGTGDGQFVQPSGIGVDAAGNIYVTDLVNSRVQKFTNDGLFLLKWGGGGSGPGEFNAPSGIAVSSIGEVYVADSGNQRIQKFDQSGTFILQWSVGTGPWRVAVDPTGGFVYVTTGPLVKKYTADGSFVQQWAFNTGFLSINIGIDVGASGTIYVAAKGDHRVLKYSSSGTLVGQWLVTTPYGLAIDSSERAYVTTGDEVIKFSSDGTLLTRWGTDGSGDGQFITTEDVAVDETGSVFVVDLGNYRIQKFGTGPTPTAPMSWGRVKTLYR